MKAVRMYLVLHGIVKRHKNVIFFMTGCCFTYFLLCVPCLSVQIVKERFGMVAPDVQIEDGKGTILISSEEGETEGKEEGGGGDVRL